MSSIRIVCSNYEGETVFERNVPEDVINQSELIKNMLESCGDQGFVPLPIDTIYSEKHFDYVVEYCTYVLTPDYPESRSPDNIDDDLTDWEKTYMKKLDQETLYDLVMVANFLDIPRYLEALCFWSAEGIKGKTPEQIREQFNIEDDLTDEEKAEINKEIEKIEGPLKTSDQAETAPDDN